MMRKRLFSLCVAMGLAGVLWACATDNTAQNNAGNTLYDRGDYKGAAEAYQSAQVAAPDDPASYYNAARALAEANELEAAVAAVEQALKNADRELTAEAYYNLGNIYFKMRSYAEAVAAYRETLLIHPDDEDARYNLELALSLIYPPTPTAIEQKVEPTEGRTDPQATPTNNPAGYEGPTPTPPPQEGPPDLTKRPVEGQSRDDGGLRSTPTPLAGGTLTLEDVERLLDAVQQNQETMREYLQEQSTPGPSSDRDW